MLSANRNESKEINKNKAYQEAKALYEAGEKKWGTDESKFLRILATYSFSQLRAIFQEYSKISQKSIEEVLKSELSGDFLCGMLTIGKRNTSFFFSFLSFSILYPSDSSLPLFFYLYWYSHCSSFLIYFDCILSDHP